MLFQILITLIIIGVLLFIGLKWAVPFVVKFIKHEEVINKEDSLKREFAQRNQFESYEDIPKRYRDKFESVLTKRNDYDLLRMDYDIICDDHDITLLMLQLKTYLNDLSAEMERNGLQDISKDTDLNSDDSGKNL